MNKLEELAIRLGWEYDDYWYDHAITIKTDIGRLSQRSGSHVILRIKGEEDRKISPNNICDIVSSAVILGLHVPFHDRIELGLYEHIAEDRE